MSAYPRRFHLSGLGDITAQQITSITSTGVQIAGTSQSGAPVSTKILASVGGALSSAIPFSGPAAPFVAIAAGVVELLAVLGVGSGCGQTCVLSTQYANKAGSLIDQNLAAYFSIPPPRLKSQQQTALLIFDTIWNDLVQQCSNPALGDAGKRCITDRQAGACKWTQTGQPMYPGQPTLGQCFNWFNNGRDPIANDPNVIPDPIIPDSVTSAISSIAPAGSSIWLYGGAALLAVALLSGDN